MLTMYFIGYIFCLAISWAWLEWTKENDREELLLVFGLLALFWPVVLPIGILLVSISWTIKRIKTLEEEDNG